ncbi:unnamed protein product [Arabis nemorensis]|uniref:Phenylalanyl-tRNA synthetase domain-containing protein n=1 Tax=Arabis nemorensis TaxID=586526 RepID=A0A565BKE3_9BRAS|nr:unnamed protein product [Arabis nemorensis]
MQERNCNFSVTYNRSCLPSSSQLSDSFYQWTWMELLEFEALFQHPTRASHDTFFLNGSNLQCLVTNIAVKLFACNSFYYKDTAGRLWIKRQPFVPERHFSIDRVFRNKPTDRTHLAEFHQIEGIILGCRNCTLSQLRTLTQSHAWRLSGSRWRLETLECSDPKCFYLWVFLMMSESLLWVFLSKDQQRYNTVSTTSENGLDTRTPFKRSPDYEKRFDNRAFLRSKLEVSATSDDVVVLTDNSFEKEVKELLSSFTLLGVAIARNFLAPGWIMMSISLFAVNMVLVDIQPFNMVSSDGARNVEALAGYVNKEVVLLLIVPIQENQFGFTHSGRIPFFIVTKTVLELILNPLPNCIFK